MIKNVKTYIVIGTHLYNDIAEAIHIAKENHCVVNLILSVGKEDRLEIFIYEEDTVRSVYERYSDFNGIKKEVYDEEE